jgi:hypothetical protein
LPASLPTTAVLQESWHRKGRSTRF